MKNAQDPLPEVFRAPRGWDVPLILLFGAIHLILLFNALVHEPGIGYDARNHLLYVEAFSEYHLPSRLQTTEFFSPPLPYLLPATLRHYGMSLRDAAKGAQILNVGYSMLLCWFLLLVCHEMRPLDRWLRFSALALLGMLPVYYRSFAFVRGEPLLSALCVLVVYRTLRLARPGGATGRNALFLGLSIGAMVLSRQWGFLLLPAVIVFLAARALRTPSGMRRIALASFSALSIGALIGGWFYVVLMIDHGAPTAFNRSDRRPLSLGNLPPEFYFGTGDGKLFTDPIRSSFPDQAIPTMYADTWGDYWCYFTVYGRWTDGRGLVSGPALMGALADGPSREALQTNLPGIARYLGRVNLISLPVTVLLAGGVLLGALHVLRLARRDAPPSVVGGALVGMAVLCTLAGFFAFAVAYPSPGKGEPLKATYILQVFPLVAILGADLLVRLRARHLWAARIAVVAMIAASLHNLPVLFTRMWGSG